MPVKGTRERFMFWLDLNSDNDFEVADMITQLKSARRFTSTIRDGIRLICDLRVGRLDVLFELFPWVKAEFIAGVQPDIAPLADKLDRLEALVMEQGSGNGNGLYGANPEGPKAIPAPNIEAPVFDDDDDFEIEIRADTSTDAAQNFIDSMLNLQ